MFNNWKRQLMQKGGKGQIIEYKKFLENPRYVTNTQQGPETLNLPKNYGKFLGNATNFLYYTGCPNKHGNKEMT